MVYCTVAVSMECPLFPTLPFRVIILHPSIQLFRSFYFEKTSDLDVMVLLLLFRL